MLTEVKDAVADCRASVAPGRRQRLTDGIVAGIATAAAFGIYLRTLAPDVLDGDPGEFQYAAYSLGLPHPTGYPLYMLLGKVWTYLPIGTLAYRMNMLSAVFAALTVAALYVLLRQTGISKLVSLAASLAFAFSAEFWSQAIIAEVYTLNTLLIVVVLTLTFALRHQVGSNKYQGLAWAFAVSLGLAHHRTIIFVIPGIAAYLRPVISTLGRRYLAMLLGLIFGLAVLFYLYVPWRGPQLGVEGSVAWAAGTGFATSLGRLSWPWFLGRVNSMWSLWLGQFSLVGAIASLAGLIILVRLRSTVVILTVPLALLTFAFYAQYDVSDAGVFLLPAYVAGVIWMAAGLESLLQQIGHQRARLALGICSLVLPASLIWVGYATADMSGRHEVADEWRERLGRPLAEGAAIVAEGYRLSPLPYLQTSAGTRPDLRAIGANLGEADGWKTIQQWVDDNKVAYLLDPLSRVPAAYETEAVGTLTEVRPALGMRKVAPANPLTEGGLELKGYALEKSKILAGQTAVIDLFWTAIRPVADDYSVYVHLIDRSSGAMVAQVDKGGVDYHHFSFATSHWPVQQEMRDRFRLSIRESLPVGEYELEAGLYLAPSGKPFGVRRTSLGTLVVGEEPGAVAPGGGIATFGNRLRLVEAELVPKLKLGQQEIPVRLKWQAVRSMAEDYTFFLHMVNLQGTLVAQSDSPPAAGRYPTSRWDEGEVVNEERAVVPKQHLPAGDYRVFIGVYTLRDMQRLPLAGGGDSFELGVVQVP